MLFFIIKNHMSSFYFFLFIFRNAMQFWTNILPSYKGKIVSILVFF
jgi:hypothetical protein